MEIGAMPRSGQPLPEVTGLACPFDAAARIVDLAACSVAARGRFSLALSPACLDLVLADALAGGLAGRLALRDRIHLFFADTRHGGRALDVIHLLGRIALPARALHVSPIDACDPLRSAARYEQELRGWFGIAPGQLPAFDCALLAGDVHAALPESGDADIDRIVTTRTDPATGRRYVALARPVLAGARRLLVLPSAVALVDIAESLE